MRSSSAFLICGVVFLLLLSTSISVRSQTPSSPKPTLQASVKCPCGNAAIGRQATHPPPATGSDPISYDEQLGMTFTQSFTAMAYNVTAVIQSDPSSDTGPAYLLNGISNTGYWYQVGLAWNWNPGHFPGTGFAMIYEVFEPSGKSIFPASGGGLLSFSGPVNSEDTVLLYLYFSTSSSIVMLAKDYNTGASAYETYSSEGATQFNGSSSATANHEGFFTGLMTEWYHSSAFYGNILPVIYSNPNFALTSAWMWTDEFTCSNISCSNSTVLFSDSTSGPVSYANPTHLQEFSSHGATEFSDAYGLVTGPTYLLLTVSYTVEGGGTGQSAPTLTYSINGVNQSATLTQFPITYNVDADSKWSVTETLSGSTQSERWATNQPVSGVLSSDETVQITYYHQYALTISYSVVGGGSPSPPSVTGTHFGSPASLTPETQSGVVWLDSGSQWGIGNELGGSNSQERWVSASATTGSMNGASTVSISYYHQYALTFGFSLVGGGNASGPMVSGVEVGLPFSASLGQASSTYFVDFGSTWTVPISLAGSSSSERWELTQPGSGLVAGQSTVDLSYYHQYFVTTTVATPGGGTVSNTTGWYNSGAAVQLAASANSGWAFEGWNGSGGGAYTGQLNQTSVQASGPISEVARFYPGLVITSGSNGAVTYSFGSQSSEVQAGTSQTVYAPVGTIIDLSASPSSILYQFSDWAPSSLGSAGQTSVVLQTPVSVSASFALNLLFIGVIVGVIVVAAVAIVILQRRSGRTHLEPAAAQSPAPAVCPNCGAPVNPSLAFCENCGAKLN